MNYKALYRKWRPRLFKEIVGQDHVTRTLKNALEAGHVAHAYLFCGPRGTGKTSTAKILAKAVNCEERKTGEPCNDCKCCLAIDDGCSMDVMEIDAASNRGIDEIRELRERAGLAPADSFYRVYIIDEVHMLTAEAFNALLKTLEEPPQHVLFILATTEPHKLPATILSRCQRFNFHRVSTRDIIKRLEDVVEENEVEIDSRALRLIAEVAEGGVRDALSILEQCLAYGIEKVGIDDVRTVLGMADEEFLESVTLALGKGQSALLIETVSMALDRGKEPRQLIGQLIRHFRNLLLFCICKTPDLDFMDFSEEAREKLIKQAGFFLDGQIIRIIDILSKAENNMRWTNFPRILLEVALIKAGNSLNESESDLQKLEERIKKLEEKILPGTVEFKPAPQKDRKEKSSEHKSLSKHDISEDPGFIGGQKALTVKEVEKKWAELLKLVKRKRVTTYALLKEGKAYRLENNVLEIAYRRDQSFYVDKLDEVEHRETLKNVLSEFFRTELNFKCVFLEEKKEKNSSEEIKKEDGEDLISRAIELFGEDIVEIKD